MSRNNTDFGTGKTVNTTPDWTGLVLPVRGSRSETRNVCQQGNNVIYCLQSLIHRHNPEVVILLNVGMNSYALPRALPENNFARSVEANFQRVHSLPVTLTPL